MIGKVPYSKGTASSVVIIAAALIASSIGVPAGAATTKSKNARPKAAKPKPPEGGANQVEGVTTGKIGDMLFDGHWRFQVTGIQIVDTYTMKVPSSEQDYGKYNSYAEQDPNTLVYTPKPGYTFVTIDCYVKNAQNKTEQLDSYLNDPKTALADDDSNSYPPILMDMVSKGAWITKPLLPGSGEKMTVVFAVPTGTKPQSLVFTLKNWEDHAGKDVRVSLTP